MRWLSRLLIIVVICFVAIALPAAPAQANGQDIWLSPNSGVPGEGITVYGTNFTPDRWVDIYYYQNGTRALVAEARIAHSGDFEVDFEIPESYAGDHEVYAEDDTGLLYASAEFTAKPGLTLSPEKGPVGPNVTVQGHGFAENETGIELRYYPDSNYTTVAQNITADDDGSWQCSFEIPPSAKGNHKIDAKGNYSSPAAVKDATFEVTPGISIVAESSGSVIDEPSGSVGDNITMMGNGFAANERDIKILFDGEAVKVEIRADDRGHWEEYFEVPERLKGTYNVTAEGEYTKKKDLSALSFAIKPGLGLSPNEGYVGTNLTVSGGGFVANKDVVIKYDGAQVEATTTDSKGSFEVIFPVPESQHGEHNVTAEDAAGNNGTATFTLESEPPGTPEPISPEGSRAGFIGKVRPTFNWSAVSDDSGVRYSLQIATNANVTAGGLANPIISVTGIAATNYTLNKTQALPYGTYYWIVQAVDRAGNAGNWTVAYSFHAGLLPLWAFILIIVAIAAGIGTLVYFFIIRKRIYYY